MPNRWWKQQQHLPTSVPVETLYTPNPELNRTFDTSSEPVIKSRKQRRGQWKQQALPMTETVATEQLAPANVIARRLPGAHVPEGALRGYPDSWLDEETGVIQLQAKK